MRQCGRHEQTVRPSVTDRLGENWRRIVLTRRGFIASLVAVPLIDMLQKNGNTTKGKSNGHAKTTPNGLLNGLTESWLPNSGGFMLGQRTGLNSSADNGLTFQTQSQFPGGVALQSAAGPITLQTAASDLVSAIGNTDFMIVGWQAAGAGADEGVALRIGENDANGMESYISIASAPGHAIGSVPGAFQNYPSVYTPDQYSLGAAHMIAIWYTNADSSLHISIDAGASSVIINTDGIGAPDVTNSVWFRFLGYTGIKQCGFTAIWQGSTGVANAVSQLGKLYANKWQFSDFDAG
jgi:hypothetical protein